MKSERLYSIFSTILEKFKNLNFTQILVFCILIRLPILILAPAVLFADGADRSVWEADMIAQGDFGFAYPPLYSMWITIPRYFFGLEIAHFVFKLQNLGLFCIALFFVSRILQQLRVDRTVHNLALVLFGTFTWSLLLSVSILADMLFAALGLWILHLVISFDTSNILSKQNCYRLGALAIGTFLLFATKPMSWFLLLGLAGVVIFRFGFGKVSVLVCTFLLIGSAVFFPWLIRNYYNTAKFYPVTNVEEDRRTLEFVGVSEFGGQLERAFAYFWEFPSWQKMQNISENKAVNTVGLFYYFSNILIFGLITIISLYELGLWFRRSNLSTDLMSIVVWAAPCLVFSCLYWPFFGKNNFWDTGRYSFAVIFVIFVFVGLYLQKLRPSFVIAILSIFVSLSLLNSYLIVFRYSIFEKDLKLFLDQIKIPENSRIYTNDNLTRVGVKYYLSRQDVEYSDTVQCDELIYSDDVFSFCKTTSGYVVERKGALSRQDG